MSYEYTCGLPGCHRPCYERGGVVHGYCGRSHASQAVRQGILDQLLPPHGQCHRCHLHGCSREVFYDEKTGRVHDFCCLRHANLARERNQWPRRGSEGDTMCAYPGCENYVYRNQYNGHESDYCSWSHLEAAREDGSYGDSEDMYRCERSGCPNQRWVVTETGVMQDFCSSRCAIANGHISMTTTMRCSLPGCVECTLRDVATDKSLNYCSKDHATRAASRSLVPNTEPHVDRTFRGETTSFTNFSLSVLTNSHPDYASLKEQFLSKWVKSETMGGLAVRRIFKIKVPRDIYDMCKQYQTRVGNVRRRFHGTSCSAACTFFVNLKGGPCSERTCNVCNICTQGFKLAHSGQTAQRTGLYLRFGQGLYFSSVSGKANDYAAESEKIDANGKRVRCMFMASVAVGRPLVTNTTFIDPQNCPQQGYDSIVAEPGGGLNYDEVVVYDEDAAIPTHLVVYTLRQ